MEFNYVFTKNDFEFYKLVTLDTLRNKVKFEKIYHYVLLLLFLVVTLSGFQRLGIDAFVFQWVAFTLILIFLFFITNGKKLLLKRYQNVSYIEKETKQEMFIRLDDEGIYLKDFENFEYFIFSNKITIINKTKDYLIIHTKKENMIIPLRVFINNEYEEFLNYILSHTNNQVEIIEREY
ncbi:MAG: hypothetical protein K0Q49_154 [Haloplasmataceae bacterium]|jgi:hypothetical protein|nr:hypothetical protein [Haloplasmataceae bacterium]